MLVYKLISKWYPAISITIKHSSFRALIYSTRYVWNMRKWYLDCLIVDNSRFSNFALHFRKTNLHHLVFSGESLHWWNMEKESWRIKRRPTFNRCFIINFINVAIQTSPTLYLRWSWCSFGFITYPKYRKYVKNAFQTFTIYYCLP